MDLDILENFWAASLVDLNCVHIQRLSQRGELSAQSLAAGIADLISGAYDSAARRMPELLATDPGTVAAVEIVLNQSDLAKGEK